MVLYKFRLLFTLFWALTYFTSIASADTCDDCIHSCQGLSSCCTGVGCICEEECAGTSCGPGYETECNWMWCYCVCTATTPAAPTLLAPANNSLSVSLSISLTWDIVSNANEYTIQICADSACSSIVREETVYANKYQVIPDYFLSYNTAYWWRVRSTNYCKKGTSWSATRKFTTTPERAYFYFPGSGLWRYDGGTAWYLISWDQPMKMLTSGSLLFADFGPALGVWRYNGTGTSWTQLTQDSPENMVIFDSNFVGDFGVKGVWMHNGTTWIRLTTANPEKMVASHTRLYLDFGAVGGLCSWEGGSWAQLTKDNPENMIAYESTLVADFGAKGLWAWEGKWKILTAANSELITQGWNRPSVPTEAVFVTFNNAIGLYYLSPSTVYWLQTTSDKPENMIMSGEALYADFGTKGLYAYYYYINGSYAKIWTKLSVDNVENMIGVGSKKLYADFANKGLWVWNGSWTLLAAQNPTIMASN